MADDKKNADKKDSGKHGGGTPAKSGPNLNTGKHAGKDADKKK